MKNVLKKLAILSTLFAAIVFFVGNGFAADEYKIDTAHSTFGFKVQHLMVSNVMGSFDQFEGTITLDADDLAKSVMDATIQTTSINTHMPKRDDHLRSADFFDAANNPTITFKSTKITKQGDQYSVTGNLMMKGVTKEITFPATISGPIKSPMGGMVIGLSANFKLNRQDYGIFWNKALDSGGYVVSDEVAVNIEVEAHKQ